MTTYRDIIDRLQAKVHSLDAANRHFAARAYSLEIEVAEAGRENAALRETVRTLEAELETGGRASGCGGCRP